MDILFWAGQTDNMNRPSRATCETWIENHLTNGTFPPKVAMSLTVRLCECFDEDSVDEQFYGPTCDPYTFILQCIQDAFLSVHFLK